MMYFFKLVPKKFNTYFKSCHCSITYTSGLAVDSLINGCPTIACNDGNFCYEVSQNDPLEVENIKYFDRSQWINNLSYCQWDLLEIKTVSVGAT